MNYDPRHIAIRQLRDVLQPTMIQLAGVLAAIFPDGPEASVTAVCQWEERECETLYLTGPTGNVVRVRVDGVDAENAAEFMAGEPGVEYFSVEVPDDPGGLLNGELGL